MAQMLEAAPRHAALLSLPADMLCKIASHVVAPDLVVAAGRDVSARTALRKGTDAAERSRFGGIGLYRRLRPIAYGLIVGYVFAAGCSFLVDAIWFPDEGHLVHSY